MNLSEIVFGLNLEIEIYSILIYDITIKSYISFAK